jgi:hypothetical protein
VVLRGRGPLLGAPASFVRTTWQKAHVATIREIRRDEVDHVADLYLEASVSVDGCD